MPAKKLFKEDGISPSNPCYGDRMPSFMYPEHHPDYKPAPKFKPSFVDFERDASRAEYRRAVPECGTLSLAAHATRLKGHPQAKRWKGKYPDAPPAPGFEVESFPALGEPDTGHYCREVQDAILSSLRDDLATFADLEAVGVRLDEEVDGTETVIYTGRALCYLFASTNDDAAAEELGEKEAASLTTEQRCYWAIRADVMERTDWTEMLDAVENDRVAEYLAETAEEQAADCLHRSSTS